MTCSPRSFSSSASNLGRDAPPHFLLPITDVSHTPSPMYEVEDIGHDYPLDGADYDEYAEDSGIAFSRTVPAEGDLEDIDELIEQYGDYMRLSSVAIVRKASADDLVLCQKTRRPLRCNVVASCTVARLTASTHASRETLSSRPASARTR